MTTIRMILTALAVTLSVSATAQEANYSRPAFPQVEGARLSYRYKSFSKDRQSSCIMTVRNVTGDSVNGSLDMVYNCFDSEGKAYFDGTNEFVMSVVMKDGLTYITMDKMAKTLKVMDMITAGDASSVRVPMAVGDTLPATVIYTRLGKFNATVSVSDRIVLDHRTMTVGGSPFECWLVQECTETKTPFGTNREKALTWYAEGVGCVSQKVYDGKGKLRGILELEKKIE